MPSNRVPLYTLELLTPWCSRRVGWSGVNMGYSREPGNNYIAIIPARPKMRVKKYGIYWDWTRSLWVHNTCTHHRPIEPLAPSDEAEVEIERYQKLPATIRDQNTSRFSPSWRRNEDAKLTSKCPRWHASTWRERLSKDGSKISISNAIHTNISNIRLTK